MTEPKTLMQNARNKHSEHQLHWAADLMLQLENESSGRALQWAIECMRALVQNAASPHEENLTRWLTELSHAFDGVRESSVLLNKAQEIWHQHRDLLHTGVAHLYAALGYLSQHDVSWYRRSIVSALDVMGDCEFYRESSVEIPLALFEKFTTARQESQ